MARLPASVTPASAEALAAVVRGVELPLADDGGAALAEAAGWHGLLPLVDGALARRADTGGLDTLRAEARVAAREGEIVEMLRARDLGAVLRALAARDVHPLIVKGAAISRTHYPRPGLRPRVDTDLLIGAEQQATAREALVERGCRVGVKTSGTLVSYQFHVARVDDRGFEHVYDVHWKIADPLAFGEALSYEEAAREAVAIPVLGPFARALSPVHALLLACAHRIAHHRDEPRLIWVYDIHLLAGRLDRDEAARFTKLARERGIAGVSRQGLLLAAGHFGTELSGWAEQLDVHQIRGVTEPSAAYLDLRFRKVDALRSDLDLLPTWRHRVRLVAEHLFPPRDFVRARYRTTSTVLLPFLYAHRAIRGVRRWLGRGDT